jgi:small-conductance mechanosensitive channel/CRP-like cAMP-binding protein
MTISLSQSWLLWGLVLVVGFPLLMVALGELILQLEKRQHPFVKVVREVRNWVLPLAALFFLLTQVLGVSDENMPIKIVATLAWVALIGAALSLVNALLFTGAKPNSWQAEIPKLFRDLVRTFLIAIGFAIVLSAVFGVDLGGLIAALGIGSVVIGLALQDTLGNLFSGVALLFERPFQIGDWLQVGEKKGKVLEINWRSVHLVTRELEQLIVPNSVLAKEIIRNYSQPKAMHVEPVMIGFSYGDAPNKVKRVMQETALDTRGVMKDPAPIVVTVSYDDFAITYMVRLFIEDYDQLPMIRNEFVTRIWYAARRNSLTMPFPTRDVYHHPLSKANSDDSLRQLARYMSSLPSLAMVTNDVLEEAAAQAVLGHFGKGESIICQGQQNVKVHFVLAGEAIVVAKDLHGHSITVAELSRGDFFGYSALLANEPSGVTVTAAEDLEVLILETESMQTLLNKTPRFAQQISAVIAARQNKIKEFKTASRARGVSLLTSQPADAQATK